MRNTDPLDSSMFSATSSLLVGFYCKINVFMNKTQKIPNSFLGKMVHKFKNTFHTQTIRLMDFSMSCLGMPNRAMF